MTRWQEFRRWLHWHEWLCWHHWDLNAPGHKDICINCGKRRKPRGEKLT